ncbi:NRAMP family divalent metal transporter [Elongatibacter sediminis]|uniref:Divalent metal cation transporter n=1 Tax=Elongatibacter sediminis TaxID=3119006 RepID=A0AAW9R4Q6_9GAMM
MNWIVKLFRGLVGPAAVIAAGSMGAGAVASLILAGAWFRYDLLWVVLFMLPLFVIAVDSASRIGTINRGVGMLSIVSRHIHPSVAWLFVLINVPIHILVGMGQFSVMTSAFLSLFGMHPPVPGGPADYAATYGNLEIIGSLALAAFVLWLVLSQGYDRMQKAMTGLMVVMFICFLLIALRSFGDIAEIMRGFIPSIPDDLPAPGRDAVRMSTSSIIAIVGSAIAPGALLTIPYLSSDASSGAVKLKEDLRKSILNLGIIFGAYAMFIIIAGGFALYPLANHADIETVHEAGQVLTAAFPQTIAFVGPTIFTLGLFIAAMTTLVICVQVVIYLSLDILKKPWTFSSDNKPYRRLVIGVTLLTGLLAPIWDFPALLKVVLLMGVNVLVIPLVIGAMIFLVNRRAVMGEFTASPVRNALLVLVLVISVALAIDKFPDYLTMLAGMTG